MAFDDTTPPTVAYSETAPVALDETERLIASDKVQGTEVFGRNGERLGTVYNFMVDKITGRVAYAVMSFGGFLGLGERYHPLPWEALTYDPTRGGYVVDLDREKLEHAPSFAAGEEPWRDPEHRRNVFGFYGFNYGL
ncbi:MAG: PRC-barrel domain-containing protein [Janthinobacterium lividum]